MEKVQFVKWYFQGCSSREISDNFAAAYPDRPIPSKTTVLSVVERFESTGCVDVKHTKVSRNKTALTEENTEIVVAAISINPRVSLRDLSSEFNISKDSCHRALQSEGYKSYKIKKVQHVHDGDEFRRMEFCQQWMERMNANPRLKSRILFTDECSVNLEGYINKQNDRMWAINNPHETHDHYHQVRKKVNVWVGILGSHILGPHFLEGNLNGNGYLLFLQNVVIPELNQLHLNYHVLFMHDGCPAHGTNEVGLLVLL